MSATTEGRPARTPVRAGAALRVIRQGLGAVGWYVQDLMGDTAYRRYLEHHHAHHGPEHAPMTEREFWRARMDDQDRNPGARCC